MGNKSEHSGGQRDGSVYKKQGTIERIFSPRFNPRGGPKERDSYSKGHKNGRR